MRCYIVYRCRCEGCNILTYRDVTNVTSYTAVIKFCPLHDAVMSDDRLLVRGHGKKRKRS